MLNRIRLSSPFICFLPILAILPIFKDILLDIHPGGLNTLYKFFSSALFPSFNYLVVKNALNGIKITIAIALIGWLISLITGLILGLISSETFYKTLGLPKVIKTIITSLLAIPRGIHELIWGLVLLQFFGLTPWVAILAISIPYSALMARVFSDQIDTLDAKAINALKAIGAGSLESLLTSLVPRLLPIIITHGGYRLECAIRGATLLGVFGLGGIGTELQLSIQSLQFKEVWTSLWVLGITIFLIERLVLLTQSKLINERSSTSSSFIIFIFIVVLLINSISTLGALGLNSAIRFNSIELPHNYQFIYTITNLKLFHLIFETIKITILASGFAIGIPPLLSILFPTRISDKVINLLWLLCRLIPTPLIALLLLLCINPSVSLAALAIGISNAGVMGKILHESLQTNNKSLFLAIKASGASDRTAWLYGKLSQQSNAYLLYSLYRVDIILKETAVVGVVGGVGLGWQLQESLSSFAWEEVLVIVSTFVLLTMLGELISQKLKLSLNKDLSKEKTSYQPRTPACY